jgi:hypothetical protein
MQGSERRWERTHENGWLTMATEEPDGSFRYTVREGVRPQANWCGRTSDLSRAQLLADDHAHGPDCRCPDWVRVDG